MPIVPQFDAGNPAQPATPTLERERRPRADVSAEINGLGRLAQQMRQGTEPLPNVSPDSGQGGFRGMSAVGAGMEQFDKYPCVGRRVDARGLQRR